MPKVSFATLIDEGLVGPKPRPIGVGDGLQVDIPVLFLIRYEDGVTKRDKFSGKKVPFKAQSRDCQKIYSFV